ncbi:unnamed protein product [Colias eurytheme]|nr:unnamed protein product [Colias eurytheme]
MTSEWANSTSDIWCFDKSHYLRACCARLLCWLAGGGVGVTRSCRQPHMLRNVRVRGAGCAGRETQGRRQHTGSARHAHTRAADTTPAPEERHCALS